MEGFLDAPGGGGADALVNRECLPQVLGGLAGIAVLQVAVAESFQGAGFLRGRVNVAGFLRGRANVSGDGQCLGVMLAGLRSVCGPGRQSEA